MYLHRSALFLFILSLASCTVADTDHAPSRKNPDYPVHNLFLERRSRYSLKRRLSCDKMAQQLNSLFEAARWGASPFNTQPWRFIYGINGTKAWDTILSTLMPFNKEWAQQAGALIVILSKKSFEKSGKPSKTHLFDTGMATAQLMLEAVHRGLIAHPMSGFDGEKARSLLKVPTDYEIVAVVAIGEATQKGDTPVKEFLERDKKPQTRKKIAELAFEGSFPTKR